MISYGRQTITKSDIDVVIEVMKGEMLTQGPYVENFENDLRKYFGTDYASAVSNGTAALHLTGIALEWSEKDNIITSPLSFLATANSIEYSGANTIFADIDETSFTLDPNKVEDSIKKCHKNGKNVSAIIGVDFAGHPCDWISLRELADKYDLKLINDNCHALGASYFNNKAYAGEYADIVTQSYHPVKNITTGEGGSVLTNDCNIYEKISLLRTHGIEKDPNKMKKNHGTWHYEMNELGFNYRITDLQSALGSNQLKKLDKFIKKRKNIALMYNEYFKNMENITTPKVKTNIGHAYHLYPIQIDFDKIKIEKNLFFRKLRENGIILQVHYIPIHLQPYYKKKYGYKLGSFPISERFYAKEVSLPIYPLLTNKDISKVTNEISNFISL